MLIKNTMYRYKGFDVSLQSYHWGFQCYATNEKIANICIKVIGNKKYALHCVKTQINKEIFEKIIRKANSSIKAFIKERMV